MIVEELWHTRFCMGPLSVLYTLSDNMWHHVAGSRKIRYHIDISGPFFTTLVAVDGDISLLLSGLTETRLCHCPRCSSLLIIMLE